MEGPSLIILLEETGKFAGKKITGVSGNTKTIDLSILNRKSVRSFSSWGKHFFICFDKFFLKIHFLMFGSYTVDKPKDRPPRLQLNFKNGTLYMYTCSVQMIEGSPIDLYDWKTDLMSEKWSSRYVLKLLTAVPEGTMVCDALLDQNIFSGSGNIIKNEVLFRLFLHPEREIGSMNPLQVKRLIAETRKYCFEFYEWKKKYELRKHWNIYKQRLCPRCNLPVQRQHTGALNRLSHFCPNCQK